MKATRCAGFVVAVVAAASSPMACSSSPGGGAPPLGGTGSDDAALDQGMSPTEGGKPDGPTGDSGEGGPGDGGGPQDAAGDGPRLDGAEGSAVEGGGLDGGGLDGGGTDGGLQTDAPPPAPEGGVLCPQGESWGPAVPVLTTAAADATLFGGVTPDELTLAWTSTTAGVVTAWYADRASTAVPFGAPQALSTTFGALSFDRVSLSGTGLRIVGLSASGLTFVAAKRAARPGPFATDDSAEFTGITGGEGPKSTYATPLLSGDDAFFFYIVASSTDDHVVNQSAGGPPWMGGAYLSATQLERVGTQYRRPSGLSADDLALFYWDETSSTESIAYRATTGGDFSLFVNLGVMKDAVPTASCSRLYYSTAAASGAINIVYTDGTPPDD